MSWAHLCELVLPLWPEEQDLPVLEAGEEEGWEMVVVRSWVSVDGLSWWRESGEGRGSLARILALWHDACGRFARPGAPWS